MQINTKTKLKNVDGKELELTIGEAISNILVSAEEGGKMKLWILGQKFYNDKSVELDASDVDLVKSSIDKTKIYKVLVTGQLLVLIDELKAKK